MVHRTRDRVFHGWPSFGRGAGKSRLPLRRRPLAGDQLRYAPSDEDSSGKHCALNLRVKGSDIIIALSGGDRPDFCGQSASIEGAYKRFGSR
ncbi:MAG: hypothetical protein ACLPSF_08010 [Methylocella sp.]